MTDTNWILDVDTASFPREVLDRSHETTVVVDFWAPWCGPCKTLGPMLERLAREGRGRFVLAKVDTDQNVELAQAFRIRGIPMVLAFRDGKPVDGFTGVQPEDELRAFVDRVAPELGAEQVEEALAREASGDAEGAIALLRELLREKPRHLDARVELTRILLDAGREQDAKAAFEKLREAHADDARVQALAKRLELVEEGGDVEELQRKLAAAPDDLATRVELGRALVAANRPDEGLDALLEVVRRDPAFDGQAGRRAMLEAFEVLGHENPLVNDYRRRLQMLLF